MKVYVVKSPKHPGDRFLKDEHDRFFCKVYKGYDHLIPTIKKAIEEAFKPCERNNL